MDGGRLSLRGRLLLAVFALAAAGLVAVAARLTPDPRGFGTHEQLDLAPCRFRVQFGVRCPTCGMTTAWAWAVRGKFGEAASASVGGLLAWLATIASGAWSLTTAIAGRLCLGKPSTRLALWCGSGWLAISLVDWLRRLATG